MSSSGDISRDQLVYLFDRFDFLTSQSDVKKKIADAVKDNQEALAVTTAIQQGIFMEMGVDPRIGIECLAKLNLTYNADQDLMIRFYKFVAREEMACEEAELEPDDFMTRMHSQQKLHEQQLEMLKHLRKYCPDDQSAILEKLHRQMEDSNFNDEASLFSIEHIHEIVHRKVSSPLFRPS